MFLACIAWFDVCNLVLSVCILLYRRLDDIPEGDCEEGYYFEQEEDIQGLFASQGKPSYKFNTLSYILLTLFYSKFCTTSYYVILVVESSSLRAKILGEPPNHYPQIILLVSSRASN